MLNDLDCQTSTQQAPACALSLCSASTSAALPQ